MPFNYKQQKKYRFHVAAAWEVHKDQGGTESLADFTRSNLKLATGKTSTKDCSAGRDFDRALAHFKALADDIDSSQDLSGGELTRIQWSVNQVKGIHPDFMKRFPTDSHFEKWIYVIAAPIVRRKNFQLHELTDPQIASVTAAACNTAKHWRPHE